MLFVQIRLFTAWTSSYDQGTLLTRPCLLETGLKTTTQFRLLHSNEKLFVQTTKAKRRRTTTSLLCTTRGVLHFTRGPTRHVRVLLKTVFRKSPRRQSCQKLPKTVLCKFPTFTDLHTKFHVFCHVINCHVSKPQNFFYITTGPSKDTARNIQGSTTTLDIHTWLLPINRGVDLRQESHPQNGWHVSIQNLKPQASLNRSQSHYTIHISLCLQELSIS